MPVFPAPARRFLVFYSTAAVLLLTAAGCRSTQSAYQFRPAPPVATAPRPTAPAQPHPAGLAAAPPAAPVVSVPPARPVATLPARPTAGPTASAVPLRLARQLSAAHRPAYTAVVRPARRNIGATDGAQATAEVGLGTTVLGVLGLVVGPISLIGLLIWGGPVWAVLLGLSALAVLVAYLDPFR